MRPAASEIYSPDQELHLAIEDQRVWCNIVTGHHLQTDILEEDGSRLSVCKKCYRTIKWWPEYDKSDICDVDVCNSVLSV